MYFVVEELFYLWVGGVNQVVCLLVIFFVGIDIFCFYNLQVVFVMSRSSMSMSKYFVVFMYYYLGVGEYQMGIVYLIVGIFEFVFNFWF